MGKRWREVSRYAARPGVETIVFFDGKELYAYLTWMEGFGRYAVSVRNNKQWYGATHGRSIRGALSAATRLVKAVKELNAKYKRR